MTDRLVEAARAAQRRAHAPYSNYQVGAALETEDGAVFTGCNVENASYGLGMCAERVAVGTAVAAGHRRFVRVVVTSDSDPPASPCGACRQVLAEFALGAEVIAVGPRQTMTWTVAGLLPDAFTADRLR